MISGVSQVYPGSVLVGGRRRLAHHPMCVLLHSCWSCFGSDLSLRSGLSVPGHRGRDCHRDCLADFLLGRGKHPCRSLLSLSLMCLDLPFHLGRSVGVPLP